MLQQILERVLPGFAWLWRQHERAVLCDGGTQLSKIIITDLVIPDTFLAFCLDTEWHLFINPDDWMKIEKASSDASLGSMPASALSLQGIPVIKDDEFARRVLSMSLQTESEQPHATVWQRVDEYLTEGMRKLRGEK